MSGIDMRRLIAALAVAGGAVLAVVGFNSLHWVGTTMPGFFLMENRVVPSIALPHWADGHAADLFQHEIVEVDGSPVTTAWSVYDRVATLAPNTPIDYGVRRPDGTLTRAVMPTLRFGASDWLLLFGTYFVTGIAFLATGLIVGWLRPTDASARGLLACGAVVGTFAFTAADLYGPGWFFRFHVIAECFVGAALGHLALVFPVERFGRRRRAVLAGLYLGCMAIAVGYEAWLYEARVYTRLHLAASATHAVGALAVVASVLYELSSTSSPLVRRRIGVVGVGAVAALIVPALAMGGSALLGGTVPVNVAGLTAFLFPLSIGYAVVKRDLFEIDAMLRRAITYVVVALTLGALYFVVLAGLGLISTAWAQSPLANATVNLTLIMLFAPLRARVQDVVDRVFFRKAYDGEEALAQLSNGLMHARTVDEVVAVTRDVLGLTLQPTRSAVYWWSSVGVAEDASNPLRTVRFSQELADRVSGGAVLTRYESDDGGSHAMSTVWQQLEADVLMPISLGGWCLGFLAVGSKASGGSYNVHDVMVLRALCGQLGLALANAKAYVELGRLHRQVQDRTHELEETNNRLEASMEEGRRAYGERERVLAVRAQFVAQASHEFRTPLAVILSAAEALERYHERMTAQQRTMKVDRIKNNVLQMKGLLEEVLTLSAMDGQPTRCTPEPIPLDDFCREQVEEARLIGGVRHRFVCTSDTGVIHLDPDLTRRVLGNLLQNAIKYSPDGGTVILEARRTPAGVVFRVSDEGIGIGPDDLKHVFDPFHRGANVANIQGSGLGLSITKRAVEAHGGTITVEPGRERGTVFVVTMPPAAMASDVAPSSQHEPVRKRA